MEDWQKEEIKNQEEYIKDAKAEKESLENLAEGLKLVGKGFMKISKAVKYHNLDERIQSHLRRIEEIKNANE